MQKCIEVPIANGAVKEVQSGGKYKIQLDQGGRIEAFAIVRKISKN